MIVKCNRLYNPNTRTFYSNCSDGYTTIGNFYSVIEIYYSKEEIEYRIFSDGNNYYGHPILVRANDFEIVSGLIPNNWELHRYGDAGHNLTILGPKIWHVFDPWEESFWQDFDNNIPKARECFDKELKTIFETDAEYIKLIDEQQNREPYFK